MAKLFRKFAICYEQRRYRLNSSSRCPGSHRLRPPVLVTGLLALLLAACFGPDTPSFRDNVLIQCDQRTVTRGQFERAFEAARIAYSDDRSADRQIIADARLRLLNQMTEEIVIDRRAQDLGIVLDDQEMEAAITDIKADYPPGEFEQMLLESAISFALWKDRLRIRLLMQKVVDVDVAQALSITPQEIQAYYKAHETEFAVDDETAPQPDLTRHIVERLRRQKVEARYPQWIAALNEQYQLSINWDLWNQLQPDGTESSRRPKDESP